MLSYSDLMDYADYAGYSSGPDWGTIFSVISVLLALAATVLAFIFIMPSKKRDQLSKPLQILHDIFNFNGLIIEVILKAVYIFATAFAIIGGFFSIFAGENFFACLLIMILGPIVIRIIFEFSMIVIILVKNVIQINKKLKYPEGEQKDETFGFDYSQFAQSKEEPAEEPTPVADVYCINCGNKVEPGNAFCPHCGKSVQ